MYQSQNCLWKPECRSFSIVPTEYVWRYNWFKREFAISESSMLKCLWAGRQKWDCKWNILKTNEMKQNLYCLGAICGILCPTWQWNVSMKLRLLFKAMSTFSSYLVPWSIVLTENLRSASWTCKRVYTKTERFADTGWVQKLTDWNALSYSLGSTERNNWQKRTFFANICLSFNQLSEVRGHTTRATAFLIFSL